MCICVNRMLDLNHILICSLPARLSQKQVLPKILPSDSGCCLWCCKRWKKVFHGQLFLKMLCKHPSVFRLCLLCMWMDWKKLKSDENGTETVQFLPFFTTWEISFCSEWKCCHNVSKSVQWQKCVLSYLYIFSLRKGVLVVLPHAHTGVSDGEGWRGISFPLFFVLTSAAPLLACWDFVSEPQALSLSVAPGARRKR